MATVNVKVPIDKDGTTALDRAYCALAVATHESLDPTGDYELSPKALEQAIAARDELREAGARTFLEVRADEQENERIWRE